MTIHLAASTLLVYAAFLFIGGFIAGIIVSDQDRHD